MSGEYATRSVINWNLLPDDPTDIFEPNMSARERDDAVRDYVIDLYVDEINRMSGFLRDLVLAEIGEIDWAELADGLWEDYESPCAGCGKLFPGGKLTFMYAVGYLCPGCLEDYEAEEEED